jgi:hypothetical protein
VGIRAGNARNGVARAAPVACEGNRSSCGNASGEQRGANAPLQRPEVALVEPLAVALAELTEHRRRL